MSPSVFNIHVTHVDFANGDSIIIVVITVVLEEFNMILVIVIFVVDSVITIGVIVIPITLGKIHDVKTVPFVFTVFIGIVTTGTVSISHSAFGSPSVFGGEDTVVEFTERDGTIEVLVAHTD